MSIEIEDYTDEPDACEACSAMVSDCVVQRGERQLALCWLCAHHVKEHGARIEDAPRGDCSCDVATIYPDAQESEN